MAENTPITPSTPSGDSPSLAPNEATDAAFVGHSPGPDHAPVASTDAGQNTPDGEPVVNGEPDAEWTNVHPLTPLIESWQAIVALVIFFAWQNPEFVESLWHYGFFDYIIAYGAWRLVAPFALVALALGSVFAYLQWKRKAFAVGSDGVWFRQGLIFRTQRHARYERIQAVDVVHPLLGRLFGLGKLRIEVAGGSDSHVDITYLTSSTLESLRAQITTLATGARRNASPRPGPSTAGVSHTAPAPNTHPSAVGAPAQAGAPSHAPIPGDETGQGAVASPLEAAQTESMAFEHKPLYSVPVERHVWSLVRSARTAVWLPIFVSIGLIALVMLFLVPEASAGLGIVMLTMGAGIVQSVWKEVTGNFNFTATLADEGIRVRRGLTETRSQTIPPGRVHAVEVSQPLLWRKPDWYRVHILQAGYRSGGEETRSSDVLLPVGTRLEAEQAMWLVAPDLGVDDPLALIEAGLKGVNAHDDGYFVGVPKRVWTLDPKVWRRRAFCLTNTALVIRDGWWRRRMTIIPVERIQALQIDEGPIDRHLEVADINLHMVPGSVSTTIFHAEKDTVTELTAQIMRLSAARRRSDHYITWHQRVHGAALPFAANMPEEHSAQHSAKEPANAVADATVNTHEDGSEERTAQAQAVVIHEGQVVTHDTTEGDRP